MKQVRLDGKDLERFEHLLDARRQELAMQGIDVTEADVWRWLLRSETERRGWEGPKPIREASVSAEPPATAPGARIPHAPLTDATPLERSDAPSGGSGAEENRWTEPDDAPHGGGGGGRTRGTSRRR